MRTRARVAALGAALIAGEAAMVHLGRTYGSTRAERSASLPGDELIPCAGVQTDHAVTIDASPAKVWPWLLQMGWGRGGWYTARWVDQVFFPDNGPSLDTIRPELQDVHVGSFIPDGPPRTGCGFTVVEADPQRILVLRSNSHLPAAWRRRASLDWTWTFALTRLDDGRRTRFHFRSRWSASPWWLVLVSWAVVVPADFVMGRDMLQGVKARAESLESERAAR